MLLTRTQKSGKIDSLQAGLTQLVECQLPKLDVAGSNPVSRSILFPPDYLKALDLLFEQNYFKLHFQS